MKKEDIFRYLNKGKRKEYYVPTEKKEGSNFIVELYSYTGKVIKKRIEKVVKELKEDLHIVFKPTKTFTKKSLKGVDKYDLINLEKNAGIPTTHDTSKEVSNRSTLKKDDGFVNWFDLEETESKKQKKTEKRITLLKADGTVVGLDNPSTDVVY